MCQPAGHFTKARNAAITKRERPVTNRAADTKTSRCTGAAAAGHVKMGGSCPRFSLYRLPFRMFWTDEWPRNLPYKLEHSGREMAI